MRLAVFDIDRTLLQTRWRAGHGFVQALSDVTGITGVSWDWGTYRYSSDTGIVEELFERHLGRLPAPDEIVAIQERFLEVLAEHAAREDGFVAPVPGAIAFVAALLADPEWAIALATGNWRGAAHRKLELAGFDLGVVPAAYADDARDRHAIIATAVDRAEAQHGAFERVVYLGDAPWDVRAAKELAMPFCGIAGDDRHDALRAAGARAIIADYRDEAAARRALADAPPPAA